MNINIKKIKKKIKSSRRVRSKEYGMRALCPWIGKIIRRYGSLEVVKG